MGQKVNPTLIRIGIPSSNTNNYLNPITSPQEGLFQRKDRHNFPIHGSNYVYGKKLQVTLVLEKAVEEIFEKSGYIINQLKIRQSWTGYTIYVDAYLRKATADPIYGSATTSLRKKRKISWTARKSSWRKLSLEDLEFFSQFFQKYITASIPVQWKFRPLNPQENTPKRRGPSKIYQEDAENIFQILGKEPAAELLASFMSLELRELQNQQPFIDFVFEEIQKLLDTNPQNLMGALVTVKGRINGSDRSKKSSFRKGSLPLQTFDAAIDYSCKEVITRYGVCSIKVWLRYS